jgi:Asp-tRNA(Asn)/Glu-tRNA(Gln) amidotransferase A subunit family amidase
VPEERVGRARSDAAGSPSGAAELLALSLTELVSRIRARRLSPVELMQAVLARVDAANPELNAIVALREREALLADAHAAEARAARGEARPLEGIPLGVKDLEHAEGLPNSEGSLLFAGRISGHDTTQVRRLRAAGAILLGKTNAPEFGHTALTKNRVYGVTHSPWNAELTPGGSSGGSAAALAGGLCPLVTASDGGGSIRIPASFTGCFGLKVSYGRVPCGPFEAWDYEDTSVAGPLAKTVADAALQLDLTCGASPCDPNSLPHPGLSYVRALDEPLPSGLRIGFSPDLGYAVVQSDVAAVVEDAASVFAKLGHTFVSIEGGPPELGKGWGLLSAFQLLSRLHPHLPERAEELSRSFLRGLELARRMTPERWGALARERAALGAWAAGLFERVDLLLTPTVPYDPPPARGPFPEQTEGRAQPPFGVAAFTIPWNLAWNPAASVRAGLSRRGLPVGLQIVGPRHRDDLVLRAALAFERERPWHPHWPIAAR